MVWPSQLPVCEVRPGGGPGLALTGSPDAASCGGAAAATLLDVVSKVGTLTGGALTGGALAGGTALTGPGAGALAEGCLAGALGRFFWDAPLPLLGCILVFSFDFPLLHGLLVRAPLRARQTQMRYCNSMLSPVTESL